MGTHKIELLKLKKTKYIALDKSIVKKYNASRPFSDKKYICNAPFTSIFFNFYGEALACCLNKTMVLGNYATDTVESIWNSKNAKTLRKHIIKNDLNLGCNTCKAQILSNSFFSVKSRLYDHLTPKRKYPVLLEFELDNTCNLECVMCDGEFSSAIRKNELYKQPFVKKYGKDFIEKIKPVLPKIQQANFVGGEPLLIPAYHDIIEEIIRVNPRAIINMSTNGTILNDKIKKLLGSGNFDISLSIDSVNKATYESIRKNAVFEQTMANLRYFHKYCIEKKRYFGVWVCPLIVNRYEIPEIFEFFNNINVPVYLNDVVSPRKLSIASLQKEELSNLKKHYESYTFSGKTKIYEENQGRFNDFVLQLDEWIISAEKVELLSKEMDLKEIRDLIIKNLEQFYTKKFSGTNDEFQFFFNQAKQKVSKILATENNFSKDTLIFLMNSDVDELSEFLETKTAEFIIGYIRTKIEINTKQVD